MTRRRPFYLTALAIACLLAAPLLSVNGASISVEKTPVTPDASPEARALFAFFNDIYGKKIIAGQQDGWLWTNGLSRELDYITNTTGKLPALLAMDLSACTAKPLSADPDHRIAQHAMEWAKNRDGLVELCCHWRAPMNEPAFYTKETSFDISRAVIEGTPEYAATERDLDAIAAELEILRDAHVPVLWRPLHEANGRWFWWGAGGPEPFKKLWRMMFENFTTRHHLDNLIWIFSPGAETDLAAWYPGDAFVDIVGQDHYPIDGNHGAAKDVFDELNRMTRGQRLIALGENGPIPDPALLQTEKAGWLFFTTWSGSILFQKTTPEQLRAYYDDPYVLTLADLPDWKKRSTKPARQPAKLIFCGAPGNVAAGGTWRMPPAVAVTDKNGEIIRKGNFPVTLALKNSDASLSGTLTTQTTNGIAIFTDVKVVSSPGTFAFVAESKNLRSATSAKFSVGPGNGLLRECWVDRSATDANEILGSALETPVALATNFSARITGLLIAPQTGGYQFSVAGGGGIRLWLGTNDSAASRIEIAKVDGSTPYRKWPHASEADSQTVSLAAGRKYFFEIDQAQPKGSTQLHVRWRLPDGSEERPIPAFRFEQPPR